MRAVRAIIGEPGIGGVVNAWLFLVKAASKHY
jgi:hypothetical protein